MMFVLITHNENVEKEMKIKHFDAQVLFDVCDETLVLTYDQQMEESITTQHFAFQRVERRADEGGPELIVTDGGEPKRNSRSYA